MHTCDGAKGDPKRAVLMMTIDEAEMEERTKAGHCVDAYSAGASIS